MKNTPDIVSVGAEKSETSESIPSSILTTLKIVTVNHKLINNTAD